MAEANERINLRFLTKLCEGDQIALARQLMTWGLIPNQGTYMCPRCGINPMRLSVDLKRSDGLQWYCGQTIKKGHKKRTRCDKSVGLRTGTFLVRSKLSMFQILGFVNLWVSNAPLTLICEQVEISKPSAVDWASFCREVVLDAFIAHKEKLGGKGKVVEIDESKFGKRKYHRGHPVEGQWVFGGYERGTGRVFMITVEDRSADTLLPIIQDWIHEGTTIISDYWKSYNCLSMEGYEHLRVNHSLNFKDPDTGAHTNAIESSWGAAKRTMNSCGRKKAHIPGNLARYIFQKRCAEFKLNRTVEFLRLAGSLYNPLSPREFPRGEDFTDDEDYGT